MGFQISRWHPKRGHVVMAAWLQLSEFSWGIRDLTVVQYWFPNAHSDPRGCWASCWAEVNTVMLSIRAAPWIPLEYCKGFWGAISRWCLALLASLKLWWFKQLFGLLVLSAQPCTIGNINHKWMLIAFALNDAAREIIGWSWYPCTLDAMSIEHGFSGEIPTSISLCIVPNA